MNSDELSRKLDERAGLQNYVRLSFCSKNPMMYTCTNQARISQPVMLRIKLEVVSRPGVLFSDCNATRQDAIISGFPDVVRYEVVPAKNMFAVPELLRKYYQAEVLVPSPVPPHLLSFPRVSTRRVRKMLTGPTNAPPTLPLFPTAQQGFVNVKREKRNKR